MELVVWSVGTNIAITLLYIGYELKQIREKL